MAGDGHWDERVAIGPGTRWFWEPITAQHMSRYLLADRVLPGGLVLDVACGTGFGTARLARPDRDVVGVDVAPNAIEFAKEHYAGGRVRFVHADATDLPISSGSVDGVASFETIEHLTEPASFVSELARVLRPGGLLVLSTPDRAVYSRDRTDGTSGNPFHPSEMTEAELLAALEPWFHIRERLGQAPSPDVSISATPRAVARDRPTVRAVARSLVVAITNPVIGRGWLAERLVGALRRSQVPRKHRGEPFTYLVVVAERR